MPAVSSRPFSAEWFNRHRAKFAGFAFGVAVPLLLAGVVLASLYGGLSYGTIYRPSIYFDF